MVLKLTDKKAIVADLTAVASSSLSALVADYRGLTVSEMDDLRAKARKTGVHLQVVRNTLARRALKETEFGCLEEVLVGPLILAFARNEPSAAARLFRDFVKDHEKMEVVALALAGQLLAANQLAAIASLPNREEALSMMMSVMQQPVTKLARTMAETYAQLVRVVSAVAEQKKASA